MSNLSSDALFHFTSSRDKLISILDHTFYPKYCMEQLPFSDSEEIPIAMVCFCDIPLSQITNHVKVYGKYGLGMKKQWAIQKGLNPVFYVQNDSTISHNIRTIIESTPKKVANALTLSNKYEYIDIQMAHLDLVAHIKQYEGSLRRNDEILENVKFYDEKEWRYVPNPQSRDSVYFIRPEVFNNKMLREESNKKLENEKLSFRADDIEYVIVPKEDEILPIIRQMQMIKGNRYEPDTVVKLNSRIITLKQIAKDF